MARTFNSSGSSDFLSNSTLKDTFGGATAMSLACWVYRDSAGKNIELGFNASGNYLWGFVWFSGNNQIYGVAYNPGNPQGYSAAITDTGWHHIAYVFDGSETGNNRLKMYYDGAPLSLGYLGSFPSTIASSANLGNFHVGRNAALGRWTNGAHAEFGAWTAALSPAEISALAKGYPPHRVRLANLAAYLPLIRDVVDLRGNAWTTTGTTVSTHPRRIG